MISYHCCSHLGAYWVCVFWVDSLFWQELPLKAVTVAILKSLGITWVIPRICNCDFITMQRISKPRFGRLQSKSMKHVKMIKDYHCFQKVSDRKATVSDSNNMVDLLSESYRFRLQERNDQKRLQSPFPIWQVKSRPFW